MFFFFFNDTATTEIYTLSLHDALPISSCQTGSTSPPSARSLNSFPTSSRTTVSSASGKRFVTSAHTSSIVLRSEEHTSELQSQSNLVCRLLLEKKKKNKKTKHNYHIIK